MKYVHVFSGLESADVDEGALHWPWVSPDAAEVHDRVARARTAAREAVADRVALARTAKGTSSAGAKVRTSRSRAARAASAAVADAGDTAEAADDA